MRFTLRTLLLVLATAVLFAVEIPVEAKIGLLLSACLVAAVAYLVRHGRILGAVIVIMYSALGLLLLGAWAAWIGLLGLGPAG